MATSKILVQNSGSANSSLGGTIYFKERNGMVTINVPLADNVSFTGYETKKLCTIPSEFRPPSDINQIAVAGSRSEVLRYIIKANGDLNVYNPGGAITIGIIATQIVYSIWG